MKIVDKLPADILCSGSIDIEVVGIYHSTSLVSCKLLRSRRIDYQRPIIRSGFLFRNTVVICYRDIVEKAPLPSRHLTRWQAEYNIHAGAIGTP